MLTTLLALLCGLPAADRPVVLRYLRPDGDRWVPESEVRLTQLEGEATYVSRSERGGSVMTLTVRSGKDGRVRSAEAVLEEGGASRKASLTLEGGTGRLERGGKAETFEAPADPIVTTAPDWGDVFELVRRYDAKRGGRQEFAGVWIHPVKPTLMPKFAVRRLGEDRVTLEGKEAVLDRYEVRLRSGGYLAWAGADRRVVKILPQGEKAVPVVLEGYEEAAAGLK